MLKSNPQALTVINSSPITLADPLAQLDDLLRLNVAGGDASPETLRSYLTNIGQFMAWCKSPDQGINPSLATYRDIQRYRRALVEAGYSRSTIGVKLAAISAVFRALVREGIRPDNPVEGVKPPRDPTPRRDRVLHLLYDAEEVDQIMAMIAEDTPAGHRDRAMTWLAYGHGLRVSEVVGLDLDHLAMDGSRPSLQVVAGKGGRDRVIFLVDKSLTLLEPWLASRTEIVDNAGIGPLFVCLSNRNRGHRLTTAGARYRLNEYAKAAGLYRPGRSWHGLRHGHATEATRRRVDLRTLADEMGHASLDTTRGYVHIGEALDENPARALE